MAVARAAADSGDPSRIAVVFQRPLPYLYLARYVFEDAGQGYRALDTLPLAAEPFAAALDLVFAFLLAEATRATTIDLLSSPHWRFPPLDAGDVASRESVGALDVLLRERKYLGGWDRLAALAALTDDAASQRGRSRRKPSPAPAIAAAIAAAAALRPVLDATTASAQVRALLAFIAPTSGQPDDPDGGSPRHRRDARGDRRRAVVARARLRRPRRSRRCRSSGLPASSGDGSTARRSRRDTGASGPLLLDARAAAYADVDELRLVGLVEPDWPERVRRSIFYPANLLTQLGWPAETERLQAARARFHDLLRLPAQRVSVSSFTLEDDAIVSPSSFLRGDRRERPRARTTRREGAGVRSRTRRCWAPANAADLPPGTAAWLALRASRSPADADIFHGSAGQRAPTVYAVSHVERYLECPFKYFAAHVLSARRGARRRVRADAAGARPAAARGLRDVLPGLARARRPRDHDRDARRRARRCSTSVAEDAAGARCRKPTARSSGTTCSARRRRRASPSARSPSRSSRTAGLVERLLEHPLEGTFTFRGARRAAPDRGPRPRRIASICSTTARCGSSTTSSAARRKPARALQLPIYGVCAAAEPRGPPRPLVDASPAPATSPSRRRTRSSPLGSSTSLAQALERRAEAPGRGGRRHRARRAFRSSRTSRTAARWCGYAGVCRKDYVGDE